MPSRAGNPLATDLLVVGAGPFGLALSAHARSRGIEHVVVGKPMGFWRSHMPAGMILRSDSKWHLDVAGEHTIDSYLEDAGLNRSDAEPLPLDLYLRHCDWFAEKKRLEITHGTVERLDYDAAAAAFRAALGDGTHLEAQRVVLALGMGYFPHVPADLEDRLPREHSHHTRDFVDFSDVAGKRYLIIGGRQGAFEWAALMRERGAGAVYISYRHETPAFTPSQWDWVDRMVARFPTEAGWYRALSPEEKESIFQQLFTEGRRKLEPWLTPRITSDAVRLFPRTTVEKCVARGSDILDIHLSDGTSLEVDEVLFATGYKADVARISFLAAGNVLGLLQTEDGLPVLDDGMESSVPGLHFTSSCATRDFGPFFGFTGAARASAQMIVDSLTRAGA